MTINIKPIEITRYRSSVSLIIEPPFSQHQTVDPVSAQQFLRVRVMAAMRPRQNDVKNEHEHREQDQIEEGAFGYHMSLLSRSLITPAGNARIAIKTQSECQAANFRFRSQRHKSPAVIRTYV